MELASSVQGPEHHRATCNMVEHRSGINREDGGTWGGGQALLRLAGVAKAKTIGQPQHPTQPASDLHTTPVASHGVGRPEPVPGSSLVAC